LSQLTGTDGWLSQLTGDGSTCCGTHTWGGSMMCWGWGGMIWGTARGQV
jgi:hypothetical protein